MSFQEYSDSILSRLHIGDVSSKTIRLLSVLSIIVVVTIVISFLLVSHVFDRPSADDDPKQQEEAIEVESSRVSEPALAHVHVVGEVVSPGMVELPEGSRISDAILLAGGFTELADQASVNLASTVEDGQQVVVRSQMQTEQGGSGGQYTRDDSASVSNEKVNINTASESELQSLDGIGPSKAQKIVEYRTSHGPFENIDDLSHVSGIGEKTIRALADKICV